MNCPYCSADLAPTVQEYWPGSQGEFLLICYNCGKCIAVLPIIDFEIQEYKETTDAV